MLGKNLFRVLAVGAFVIAPAALTVAVPGTSSAAAPNAAPKTVTCTSVTGTLLKQSLAGCTGDTSLSKTATVTNAGKTLTWTKGGANALTISDKAVTGKADTCPTLKGKKSTSLVTETGSVKSGTGLAAALKGGKTSAKVCLYAAGVQLLPKTKFTL
jgi:hypothetical protein